MELELYWSLLFYSANDGATFHRILIPSKWAGAIIGKGGVMINKLRDEVKYFFVSCFAQTWQWKRNMFLRDVPKTKMVTRGQ